MKKRLGLVFVIAFIVGLVILIFSDRIEFDRNETRVELEKGFSELGRQKFVDMKGNAEGNTVYDEMAQREKEQSVEDKETQYVVAYIDSLKDIFDKNMHLLESGDDVDVTIDLKMFKQGDEYHFGDLFWNISYEQVANGVEYSLLEDVDRTSDTEGYSYYISDSKHILYGQTATATFGFYEDQLKIVRLDFTPGEKKKKVQAFFDSTVETLIDIYGQASIKEESDTTDHASYQWVAEGTVLQIELIDSQVAISVGVREVQ